MCLSAAYPIRDMLIVESPLTIQIGYGSELEIAVKPTAGPSGVTAKYLNLGMRQVFAWACATAAFLAIPPHTSLADPVGDVLNSGEFRIFSTALKKAGLWERIASGPEVTLFVVSDRSMRDEGSAFLLETVLVTKQNQQRLLSLMSHHISFGNRLLPNTIKGGVDIDTGAPGCLHVYTLGSAIRVGPEAVVTDVSHHGDAVVYVIDRLLWQPWEQEEGCAR